MLPVLAPLRSLLLLWLLLCGLVAHASPLRLSADQPMLSLSDVVAVFEDRDGRAGIDFVSQQAPFSVASAKTLRPGYTDAAIWLRLSVVNESDTDLQRWLAVSQQQMHEVSLFLPDSGGWQRTDTGTQRPAETWPVAAPQMLLPFSIARGQTMTLYVRIVNHDFSVIAPVLWEPVHYREMEAPRGLANGLLLGCLLLMPVIGLMLFLMLQDKAFLFNVLAMLTFVLGDANVNGYLFYYFWPTGLGWPDHLLIIFRALGLVWHVLFLQTLLDTRKTMPRLHQGLNTVTGLMLLSLLGIPLGAHPLAAGVVQTTSLFSVPFMALVGWMATRQQIAGARYFTIAFIVLTLGSGLHILAQQLALFDGAWLRYVLPLSMLANNVLVLFSAIDRILLLRNEKEIAQQALLDSLKKNETELSAKVAEKTASLSRLLLETRQAKDTLTRLLAYISHDLRAPLAGILHAIHTLTYRGAAAELVQPPAWVECRRSIEISVHTQFELIDDLIDYAQGELRDFSLAPTPTYFYAWCRDIEAQTAHLAQKNGNQLQVAIPPDLPPVLLFDPRRLRQVLVNLLSNAAKFTRQGTIRWQISHSAGMAGTARVAFSVTDTGAGISAEDLKNIFAPFQQGSSKAGGNGLGLGIAQSLIAAMGGQLDLDSTQGQGSVFSFSLEVPIADEADIPLPAEPFIFPAPFGSGKAVLIADAQESIRDYLAEALHTADFDVVKATSGTQMLQHLADRAFDLLIIDQFLPDLPGDLLPRRLLTMGSPLPALIVCSASPCQHPDEWERLAYRMLLKPLRADDLLETVGSILERLQDGCRPATETA